MDHKIKSNTAYYIIETGNLYFHPELLKRIQSLDEDKQLKAIVKPKNHAHLILQYAKENKRKVLDGERYWLSDLGFWLRMTTHNLEELVVQVL